MIHVELRRLRKLHGLSLNDLARSVGKSGPWLSRVERGDIDPTFSDISCMLSHLGYKLSISIV
jgi:predicted transcriptional regulator